MSDLKNLFEGSSVFGFDSKNNEHLRVINLEGIDALKSLYPFSPKLKNVASGEIYETISFLTIHSDTYNYLLPLELLKKVSHSSEIKISKNHSTFVVHFFCFGRKFKFWRLEVKPL